MVSLSEQCYVHGDYSQCCQAIVTRLDGRVNTISHDMTVVNQNFVPVSGRPLVLLGVDWCELASATLVQL